MITIFSLPKAFIGEFETIQRNAITSWTFLQPKPEILLFGDEQGTKQIAKELKIRHIPTIKSNQCGTPFLNDLFYRAQSQASNNILCCVNSDIILLNQDFINIIQNVFSLLPQFLLVGKRYELPITQTINFKQTSWKQILKNKVTKQGFLKNAGWIDYFTFTKGVFNKIPPFALGRTFWDKWLIWYAIEQGCPVINVTDSITAIHQTHSYSHAKEGYTKVWEGKEALENIQLAGGWSHGLTINDADFILKDKKLIRNNQRDSFVFKIRQNARKMLDKFPFLYPYLLKIRTLRNILLIQ